MITLDECKKILNKGSHKYTPEQIKEIRDYLYFLSNLEIENQYYKLKKQLK